MNIVIIFLAFILMVAIISGLYFYTTIEINLPIMSEALSDYDEELAGAIKYFELIEDGEGYDDELC